MIPAPFDYVAAESAAHALDLLENFGDDAKLLAGGHSLLPLLRLRSARPSLLVDLGRLEEQYVREAGDMIAIGALTRHHDVENAALLHDHNPLVSYAAGLIGDPQVRHRGTIGGSIVHADPAGDLPAVLVALDGEVDILGADGVRTVPARDLFRGLNESAVGAAELLTEVRISKLTADHAWSYLKFRRGSPDWATVGVAAVALRRNGSVVNPALALANMGSKPLRARAAEEAWAAGADPGAVVDEGTEPPSDVRASADFRRHLARVLVRRAVEQALAR